MTPVWGPFLNTWTHALHKGSFVAMHSADAEKTPFQSTSNHSLRRSFLKRTVSLHSITPGMKHRALSNDQPAPIVVM